MSLIHSPWFQWGPSDIVMDWNPSAEMQSELGINIDQPGGHKSWWLFSRHLIYWYRAPPKGFVNPRLTLGLLIIFQGLQFCIRLILRSPTRYVASQPPKSAARPHIYNKNQVGLPGLSWGYMLGFGTLTKLQNRHLRRDTTTPGAILLETPFIPLQLWPWWITWDYTFYQYL